MRKIVKPELLAPAGSMEKLKMALLYGADAVYLGGKAFGLRAFASNFTQEELQEAVRLAHSLGRKVYVTVNIFAHNGDLEALPDYLKSLQECGVDALLISDLGVWSVARRAVPDMPLHVSTQANTTNWAAVRAWGRARREPRRPGAGTVPAGNCRNRGENRGGTGSLRPWCHVHLLFGTLLAEQLPDGTGREPRRLRPDLPLGVRHGPQGTPRRSL